MALNEIGLIILFSTVFSGLAHGFAYSIVLSLIDNSKFPFLYTPGTLYKFTKMNWFGCVMTWIILLPFTFLFELGGIIKWLFMVGRKSE